MKVCSSFFFLDLVLINCTDKLFPQVYLPAIAGHVPPQMVRAISSFMEFCYLVRRSVLDDDDLEAIDTAVADFHRDRVAFNEIRPDGYSLPRQHSLVHYRFLIQEFGAPNGLCSSITESKHIKAVKEPWRRSSRFKALGQMLVTNQRLDKLAAARVNFQARGMLSSSIFDQHDQHDQPPLATHPSDDTNNEDDDGGAVDGTVLGEVTLARKPHTSFYSFLHVFANWFFFLSIVPRLSRNATILAGQLGIPELPDLIRRFLYHQENRELLIPLGDVPLDICPTLFDTKVHVYPSAIATFFAPSDKSGTHGMFRERIRAVSSWRKGPPRHNCMFVEQDCDLEGFSGLLVARVRCFLSIKHNKVVHPCAIVSWYSAIGDQPCPDTKMWKVRPDVNPLGHPVLDVIHVDTILRNAHLMGVCNGSTRLPRNFRFHDSLDSFQAFYVNKYIDYHTHEIAF